MTSDFDHLRAAFWSSLPAKLLMRIAEAMRSAWRSSFFHAKTTPVAHAVFSLPAAQRIRLAAIAAAVAAGLQPLLMWMMPATIRPAMPVAVFIGVVLIAAFVAWQAGPLARLLSPHRPASDVG